MPVEGDEFQGIISGIDDTVNLNYFNRYAANVSEDGAIAVYDIMPSATLLAKTGETYDHQVTPADGTPLKDAPAPGYAFFPIQSNHCVHASNMYYVKSKGTDYTEDPQLSGLPLNYGGTLKTRYSLLSRDLTADHPSGLYPLLVVPSFGIGHQYTDRAHSMEFWLSTEPYAMPVNHNMFDDHVGMLTDIVLNTDYSLRNDISGLPYFYMTTDYHAKDSESGTIHVIKDTTVTWTKSIDVVGGNRYTLSLAVTDEMSAVTTLNIKLIITQSNSDGSSFTSVVESDQSFTGTSTPGNVVWNTVDFEFVVDPTMPDAQMIVEITPTSGNGVDANGLYISELGLWRGSGGTWRPSGYDVESDWDGAVPSLPKTFVAFGGETGTAFELLLDIDFLYLRGHGQVDSFQVGEWGRPMFFVITDGDDEISVYLNAERILQINKTTSNYTQIDAIGEWAVFYINEQFRYLDISTIAIFDEIIPVDIQKLHLMYGYGPKSNVVTGRTQYDKLYVADGSAVDCSGKVLFPQTTSFKRGTAHSVNIDNENITLPDYPLPTVVGGNIEDFVIETPALPTFSPMHFKFPLGSTASLMPKRDIDQAIDYLVLGISPSLNQTFSICRIEKPGSGYSLEIFAKPVNLAGSDGEFDDEFSSHFDLGYDIGPDATMQIATRFVFNEIVQTYQSYTDVSAVNGNPVAYKDDYGYQRLTYAAAAGASNVLYPDEFSNTIQVSDFQIGFKFSDLAHHSDRRIATIFASNDITVKFDSEVPLRFISMNTQSNVNFEFKSLSFEHGIEVWPVTPDNADPLNFMLKSTYCVYPNFGAFDGEMGSFLDIAANGYWKVGMPLTMFAKFIDGTPDLDFIAYSDTGQSPQMVTSLSTNRLTYNEFDGWVERDLKALTGDTAVGEYSDVQAHMDAQTDAKAAYQAIGLDIQSTTPTLSRFSNPSTRIYVTLDSAMRWPNKNYENLTIERATVDGYIDFELSPKNVRTTKWEIFDNYAIRVPKHHNLYRYELGYAVHLSSTSLKTHKPSFRRGEFFGIATGDKPSNGIATNTGDIVYVGNDSSFDLTTPFSAHFGTEVVPSAYMSREFGFFPHGGPYEQRSNLVFPLSKTGPTNDISMYVLWRNETFRRDTEGAMERIGRVRFPSSVTNEYVENNLIVTTGDLYGLSGTLSMSDTTHVTGIWVDGVLNGVINPGKWHLVHIKFAGLDASNGRMIFIHDNSQAVVNYVAAHSHNVNPFNLLASRCGSSTLVVADDGNDTGDSAYYIDDDAALFVISETHSPDVTRTIRI